MLRLDLPEGGAVEDPKHPMQPSFTLAASYAIEAAFVAYVQEIFRVAVDIKKAAGKHQKVTARVCQSAANIVNKRLASATGFVAPTIRRRGVPEGIKKKKGFYSQRAMELEAWKGTGTKDDPYDAR